MKKVKSVVWVLYIVFVEFLLLSQFFICILDRIIHTLFFFVAWCVGTHFFQLLYSIKGYLKYRRLSIMSAVLAVVIAFASSLWSLKVFHSIEMLSASIGYVCMNVFNKDVYCISNGRESKITGIPAHDVYITDRINDDSKIIDYIQAMDADLKYVKREDGGTIGFYKDNKDTLLAVAAKFPKKGYAIWEVTALDKYRYKNIWGDVA